MRFLGWPLPSVLSFSRTAAQVPAAQLQPTVDKIFAGWTKDSPSPGCVVGADVKGTPVIRAAFGMADLEHDVPITLDTIFEIGSVSKQFTAAAVLCPSRRFRGDCRLPRKGRHSTTAEGVAVGRFDILSARCLGAPRSIGRGREYKTRPIKCLTQKDLEAVGANTKLSIFRRFFNYLTVRELWSQPVAVPTVGSIS